MKEAAPTSVDSLCPDDMIEFEEITQLPIFEDMIAAHIEPDPTQRELAMWRGRKHIRDEIRPPKFNGTIANIRMIVMDEPYEQLVTAQDRGWRTGVTAGRANSFAEQLKRRYMGFIFVADAKSTGRGTIGQVQTELWYCPSPVFEVKGAILRSSLSGVVPFVNRIVAKPKMETKKFIKLDETSRNIGFTVLHHAMAHPIIQPMSQ